MAMSLITPTSAACPHLLIHCRYTHSPQGALRRRRHMDQRFKVYLTVAVSYCTGVGALYLFGYWGPFDVNVLEFVSLGDALKLAIYPVLVGISLAPLGFLLSQFLLEKRLPAGGGADTAVGRFGRRNWRPLLSIVVGAVFGVALFAEESGPKWVLLGFLVSFLTLPLTHSPTMINWIPHPTVRSWVLFNGVLIAAMAFAFGRAGANAARLGTAPLIVDVQRSNLSLTETAERPVVYLGRIGEFFALYETETGQLVLLPGNKLSAFHLKRNKRHI